MEASIKASRLSIAYLTETLKILLIHWYNQSGCRYYPAYF